MIQFPNVYLHGAKISSNLVRNEISYSSFKSGILRETPCIYQRRIYTINIHILVYLNILSFYICIYPGIHS